MSCRLLSVVNTPLTLNYLDWIVSEENFTIISLKHKVFNCFFYIFILLFGFFITELILEVMLGEWRGVASASRVYGNSDYEISDGLQRLRLAVGFGLFE